MRDDVCLKFWAEFPSAAIVGGIIGCSVEPAQPPMFIALGSILTTSEFEIAVCINTFKA
jgi:hypothetical protein